MAMPAAACGARCGAWCVRQARRYAKADVPTWRLSSTGAATNYECHEPAGHR
jgi:hypothetical protein